MPLRERCPDGRVFFNAGKDRSDGIEEGGSQSLSSVLVPPDGLNELRGGGRREADVHRLRILRSIRRRTSSQGSRFSVPASIAATRRPTSASQAVPAPGSDGPSMLPSNSAANSARAWRSSRRASARTGSHPDGWGLRRRGPAGRCAGPHRENWPEVGVPVPARHPPCWGPGATAFAQQPTWRSAVPRRWRRPAVGVPSASPRGRGPGRAGPARAPRSPPPPGFRGRWRRASSGTCP